MNRKRTYEQTASDYELWCEYVDPHATMTQEQFEQMTVEEKVQMQVEIWGPDPATDIRQLASDVEHVGRSKFGG